MGISSILGLNFEAGSLVESHVYEELPVLYLFVDYILFCKLCTGILIFARCQMSPSIADKRSYWYSMGSSDLDRMLRRGDASDAACQWRA